MTFQFSEKGFLVPDRNIPTSLAEFREGFAVVFPDSTSRERLFQSFLTYCRDLMEALALEALFLWANGSFVSRKLEPNDIDLVLFLDEKLVRRHQRVMDERFLEPKSLEFYEMDAYVVRIFPENHRNWFFTISDRAHWLDWFSKTRANHRGQVFKKGFLELTIYRHEIEQR